MKRRVLAEQEARIAMQNRLAAENEARVLAEQQAQLDAAAAQLAQEHANQLLSLQQSQMTRLELETTVANQVNAQLAAEEELIRLHQASLRDIELKLEAESLIIEESKRRAELEAQALSQAQERLQAESLAAQNEQAKFEAELALTMAANEKLVQDSLQTDAMQANREQQVVLAQMEQDNVAVEKHIAKLLAEQIIEAQTLRQNHLERLQREQQAQALMQERLLQEQAALMVANQKCEEEQTLLLKNQALEAQLKQEVSMQKENSLVLQQQVEAEKQAAETLTKQLLDRLTLEQGHHQQWCDRAKEVLQASPIPVELNLLTPANPRRKLRSPVLFSVLMSIGMVGAASWGMLQAQTSNAANVSASAEKKLPAVSQAKVSLVSPVQESLRMSYQIETNADKTSAPKNEAM